jgi:hypothetical protein
MEKFFISQNHDVRNINLINESSLKCDIPLNHISRGGVEHLIIFCFRVLLLSKFNVLIVKIVTCYGVHNNSDSKGKNYIT